MKYIEPPTHKQLKLPPPKKPPEHGLIRFILAVGTILVIIILSDFWK